MSNKKVIENGDEVKDTVTGYVGTVTGITEYLNGCRRIIIQGPIGKDKKIPDSVYIDEPQLKIIKKKKVKSVQRITGGPKDIPRSIRDPKGR